MFSLFQNIRRSGRCAGRRGSGLAVRNRRLAVERMEDRLVLSTTTGAEAIGGTQASANDSPSVITEGGWIDVRGNALHLDIADFALVQNASTTQPGTLSIGKLNVAMADSLGASVFGSAAEGDFSLAGEGYGRDAIEIFVFDGSGGLYTWNGSGGMIRMPLQLPSRSEGGEIAIAPIVGPEHPSLPIAGPAMPNAIVHDPSVTPNRQEISGARARDVAFEVAYVGRPQAAASNEVHRFNTNAQPNLATRLAQEPDGARGVASAVSQDFGAASWNPDSAESPRSPVSGQSFFRPVVAVSEDRATRTEAALMEAMEAGMTVVPHRDAAGINPVAPSIGRDELEAELDGDVGTPIWDREYAIKPWHAILTLVAATLAADRLSKRHAETELHPPRQSEALDPKA